MKIIDHHIEGYLASFISSADMGFCEIYNEIQHPDKESAKSLLIYLDKVVNKIIEDSSDQLQFEHLHFSCNPGSIKLLIAEYLVIKFFKLGVNKDFQKNCQSESLKKLYTVSKRGLFAYQETPFYVRAKPNMKAKKWLERKRKATEIFRFYQNLYEPNKASLSFYPYVIMNMQVKLFDELSCALETRPYAIPVSEFEGDMRSYVLQNKDYNRDMLDGIKLEAQAHLMDSIEFVILFDCEQKRIFREFNYTDLNEWNNNGSSFKSIILFSFGEENPKLHWLKNYLDRINTRYLIWS